MKVFSLLSAPPGQKPGGTLQFSYVDAGIHPVNELVPVHYEDSGEPLRYSLSEPLDEDVRVIFGEHVIAELEHWLCAWWGMDFYIIKKMAMVLWNGYGVVTPGNEVNE